MPGRRPSWLWVAAIAAALGGAYGLTLASSSAVAVSRHWFYVPVVLAAARFGAVGAAATAIGATLLAGPLGPGDPTPDIWLTRGAFLVGIGVLVGLLFSSVRAAARREAGLAERERRLLRQRAGLIQSVSHDFRTPLTVIHGVAATLGERDGAVQPAFRPLIDALLRSTTRLGELVSVVLAAGTGTGWGDADEQSVAVRDLIEQVLVSPSLSSRRIAVSVNDDVEEIVTAPDHLQVALRCLVDNALRYSGGDDPVDVTVERRHDHVVIDVRDQGPGIDPAGIDDAFEPLARTRSGDDRADPGLGLGLFAARRLTRGLGGDVVLRSPGDQRPGLVARILLPQRRATDRAGRVRV